MKTLAPPRLPLPFNVLLIWPLCSLLKSKKGPQNPRVPHPPLTQQARIRSGFGKFMQG